MQTQTEEAAGRKHPTIRRFDLISAILVSLTVGFSAGSLWRSQPDSVANAVKNFHLAYSSSLVWLDQTRWLGTPVQKIPSDLWVYQEILWEKRPDVVLEMGTFKGGSAQYLASVMDMIGHGRIITVDIKAQPNRPQHPRITYLLGSSISDAIVEKIRALVRPGETVMAILDSDHHRDHVLREMRTYGPIVTSGHYMLVEDTSINGHPTEPNWGPGPYEAVAEFLKADGGFTQDRSREKFLMTLNPGGWLLKR